jgi:2-C-methyl-D-erythritol 4-phosphate cytidylyltransferase
MYVTAIVLAAGKGLRLKSKISKPLIKIDSKPIIIYSLNTLSKHPCIKDIIVVANPRNLQDIRKTIKQFRIDKIKDLVLGGEVRRASVAKGLEAIDDHTDLVLIHDGVRPFIGKEMVSSVIKTAKSYGAAIVGIPVKATVKSVKVSKCQSVKGNIVDKTLDRSKIWEIQTPQVFRKDLILKAYDKFGDIDVTDDAMLVEKLGAKVSVVRGTYNNIKITMPEDLVIAEAISKTQKSKVKR